MLIDQNQNEPKKPSIAVIGGGPAGLMAAEVLLQGGAAVTLYEGKASVGRKFLIAGSSGLNLTHTGDFSDFLDHYGDRRELLRPMLSQFPPDTLRVWVESIGVKTFVGSSGKIFPEEMNAGKLMNLWLTRLNAAGLTIVKEYDWFGWDETDHLRFLTPEGEVTVRADAVVLALGGASWPQTGSDGRWYDILKSHGVALSPFKPANCGFEVSWSAHIKDKFAGSPVKNVNLLVTGTNDVQFSQRGEFVISAYGVEGSLMYAAGAKIRDLIEKNGYAKVCLDLMPDWSKEKVIDQLSKPRGKRSLSSFLERMGISGSKLSLLWEVVPRTDMNNPLRLAEWIKSLPLRLERPRPLQEAISTAGGVCFESLDEQLMLLQKPGVFCAGEMLDWEAPTGGYLINGCLATGRWAGSGVLKWLSSENREAKIQSA